MPPWSSTVADVLESHGVSVTKGLTAAQVKSLRDEYGPNELDKEEGTPLWKVGFACSTIAMTHTFCFSCWHKIVAKRAPRRGMHACTRMRVRSVP
jgi:magnesium-transporting ATPase (P-type)